MDLKTRTSTLALVRRIFDNRQSTVPRIVTHSEKPAFRPGRPIFQPFPRTSPESRGVSSRHLADFLDALREDRTLDPHHIMILRGGAVLTEGSFGAYDMDVWHITHSMCKSITGLAIGMLADDGRLSLDDRILRFFEKRAPAIALITHKNMTIRHLLTMSSGVVFNEAGAVTEKDWVRCFLESAVPAEPGKQFNYNSMNTYMLSAIIREVSGQSLTGFLEERLFGPLGIRDFYWETCPMGIEKGGWGLYIRPEDAAKIGQLVLGGGAWGGRQLISRAFLEDARTAHMKTPSSLGGYDYGYQIWVGRERNTFLFNGMYGQNVIGFPDTGILVVCNAGNNELFQQSSFFKLLDRFFPADYLPPDTLPEDPGALERLRMAEARLREDPFCRPCRQSVRSLPGGCFPACPDGRMLSVRAFCRLLDGRTYRTEDPAAASAGLLPLLAQMVQNNYTRGFQSLGFSYKKERLTLTVTEADEIHRFAVGFGKPEYTELLFHGEPYLAGVTGIFTSDEDDRPVLKIRISLLESANARILKIFFMSGAVTIRWLESPGKTYVTGAAAAIRNEIRLYPFLEKVASRADGDFLHYKLCSVMEPEITARLESDRYLDRK